MSISPINEQDIHPDNIIDAKDLHSPLPLLRLKKKLAHVNNGDIVQIDCTDFGSLNDIDSWCSRLNHIFLGESKKGIYCSYYIKKK